MSMCFRCGTRSTFCHAERDSLPPPKLCCFEANESAFPDTPADHPELLAHRMSATRSHSRNRDRSGGLLRLTCHNEFKCLPRRQAYLVVKDERQTLAGLVVVRRKDFSADSCTDVFDAFAIGQLDRQSVQS